MTARPRAPRPELPEDFARALDADPAAKTRFDAMPPSHQREHLGYIDEAKRPETRQRRIEKTLATLRAEAAGQR
jgi:uncharacterized protein YdeI (YjbR/CyaY-like superfamily)